MSRWFYVSVITVAISSFLVSNVLLTRTVENRPFDVRTNGLYPPPPASLLKIMSLDNHTVMADYLWINLILTLGKTHSHDHPEDHEHHHHHGPERHHSEEECRISEYLTEHLETILPQYIDTITDLDPRFCYPYLIGFIYSITDYPSDSTAIEFIKKAMHHNPDYWEFPYFYAFYLNRTKAAADSVILNYLRRSVQAEKSIRVFKKELVYDAYAAFYQKLNPAIRSEKLMEGVLEAFDNEELKQKLKQHLKK